MVIAILNGLNIKYRTVEIGNIDLFEELSPENYNLLDAELRKIGLEILESRNAILIAKVKAIIIDMIHHSEELPKIKFSDYITSKLAYDYTYLSNLFMEVCSITIQQYILIHKIEKVKEFLIYNEYTLTEIADKMQFSSVQYLSGLFRKMTGISVSEFKKIKNNRRINLNEI